MGDWTHIENRRTVTRDAEYELAIREWEPGDGLTCSWGGLQVKHPCGEPVAVFRTIWDDRNARRYGSRSKIRIRVLCSRHVGECLREFVGDNAGVRNPQPLTVRAEKAAREKVLANNWDEYQAALSEFLDAAEAELIAAVPEPLRRFLTSGAVA